MQLQLAQIDDPSCRSPCREMRPVINIGLPSTTPYGALVVKCCRCCRSLPTPNTQHTPAANMCAVDGSY
jgi:hypothetical protein